MTQEWSGYLFQMSTKYQKFLLAFGDGQNGKSVLCAGLIAMLGEDNVSAVPLEMFGTRFLLNGTLGKLANVVAEVGELDRVAEGSLKAFTSGDRMQFDRKHKPPIEAAPTARLILCTNSPPRFRDRSQGIWRRMLLLPFNRAVPESERIHGLDKVDWWQASGELPGMLNWALSGLRRLEQQGRFTDPETCRQALDDYKLESNPARQFMLDEFRADPNGEVVTADAYQRYAEWCTKQGRHALAAGEFAKEVVRAFPTAQRVRLKQLGGARPWGYRGIAEGGDLDGLF